jgi:AcrR family transcriptional regulator
MSPRSEEQNQRIRDERREQILQAALTVFAKKGWASAKIGDVAREAGLSHGLVYHYFRSKDEIFTELVRQAMELSSGIFLHGAELPGTPLEKLSAMIETIIPNAYQGTDPYFFLIMIQAFSSEAIPSEAKEIVEELGPRFVNSLIPVLIEGQKTGEVATGDPHKMATAFFALIQGLAISRIQSGEEMPIPDPEMVLRLFKTEYSVTSAIIKSNKTQQYKFSPILSFPPCLTYRSLSKAGDFSDNEYVETTEWRKPDLSSDSSSLFNQLNPNDTELIQIKSSYKDGSKLIALVKPDWRPILIETKNSEGELLSRISYEDDSATFEFPGKEPKNIRIRGDFFDNNTLFHFLRGYPFGSKEKVCFDLVMDGKGGSSLGSYKMAVQEIGKETVSTSAGAYDCLKLQMGVSGIADAFAGKFKFYFWFTATEPHFLVRYEDNMGHIIELTSINSK